MYKYDCSIVILNDNQEYLINCLKSIKQQTYGINKIEIIIETSKLDENILNQIQNFKMNCIIRENEKINISNCYNDGIKVSNGKYIQFINSSVLFNDKNTLNLFKQKSDIDNIFCCNMNYFDKDTEKAKKYILSTKTNKIINLEKNPGQINLCLEAFVFSKKIIENIEFDNNFNYESKIKFLLEVLINNPNYYNLGNISLTSYTPFEDNTSKNSIQYDINWYNNSLENWIKYSKSLKTVPLFIQEALMYIIYAKYSCNYNDRNKKIIKDNTLDEFIDNTKQLLNYIDDRIILQRKKLSSEVKNINHKFQIPISLRLYFLKLKEGKNVEPYVSNNFICEKHDNNCVPVVNLSVEKINVYAINYKNGKLIFDCTLGIKDYLEEKDICLKIMYGSQKIETVKTEIYNLQKIFGKTYNKKYTFQFEVEINNNYNILKPYLIYQNKEYELTFNFVRVYSKLNNFENSYWNYKGFTVENKGKELIISKSTKFKTIKLEILFLFSELKNEKNKFRVCKLSLLRILYYITKPFMKNKHIWITFDKLYKAGDNGEYIYQYGLKNNKNIYYIIKKDSPDYKRLVKQNRKHILKYSSLKAKLFALNSEVILDTHANVISNCGFEGIARPFVAGLFNPEIICIQHGLTMQDIAQYQNRLVDNIKLYCCASNYEIKNLSNQIYGYSKNQLKLTGLARYDGLKSKDKKYILITPTWRRNVVNSGVAHIKKKHNDNFKDSEYFKIYNSLINNKTLISCAKKNKYKIIYLLHPAMSGQFEDFDKNEYVQIVPATSEINYEKILTEASLMVTDYSGVQYDFAYMKKPIVYYHPETLPPHYDVGAMDYEKIGFGPVCKNEKEIVNELCLSMNNNCKIENEYKNRENNFFEYSDYNNCKRIITEVENYLKEH